MVTNVKLYSTFFEDSKDCNFIASRDGNFVDVNQSMLDLFGYNREELLQMDLFTIITDPAELAGFCQEIKRKGFVEDRAVKLHKKDGAVIECLETVTLHHDDEGNILGYTGIIRDVTESRHAEEKLKKSEANLAEAQRVSRLGSWERNLQTGEELWSEEYFRIFGFDRSSTNANRNLFLSRLHPDDRERVDAAISGAIYKNLSYDIEYRIILPDNSERYIYSKGRVIYDDEDKPLKMVGTSQDITEQRHDAQELVKYRKQLEQLVESRTEELVKLSSKLKRKVADLERAKKNIKDLYKQEKDVREKLELQIKRRVAFNTVLVHELKTPLTPMLGSSELLMQKLRNKSLLRIAENINRGTDNLSRRINELLDISKGELGYLKLHITIVDVIEILNDLMDYFTPYTIKQEQSLNLESTDSLPKIYADADRLRQVLLNLINNAIQHSGHGSNITLKARQVKDNIIIEVEDTGNGIPEGQQRQLLEPYYLFTNEIDVKGVGLGLSLSKMLVELHGGSIWFTSKINKGSCFSISIPINSNKFTTK